MRRIFSFFASGVGRFLVGLALFLSGLLTSLLSYDILSTVFFILALISSGWQVYVDAVRGILRGDFLDEKFLMSIASIGAMIIGEFSEGVAVMLFFILGEIFEHRAVRESRNKIRALMDICADEVTLVKDGEEIRVDADEVEAGDIILIRSGERAGVDARVISGFADVDTSAITGESVPVAAFEGSVIESGSIVIGGALKCEVLREASDSAAMRILDMVENATERKSREEKFISSFSRVYTPIVVSLALIMATVPSLIGLTEWSDSIYRALTFLVISCPCALVISVPLAFFGGIGAAASKGILFKGGNFFEPISKVKTVAFDKTGTLTKGEFCVKDVILNKIDSDLLLDYAGSIEYASNHPIALALRASAKNIYKADNVREIAGKGSVGEINGKRIAVGNSLLMQELGISLPKDAEISAESCVYVGIDADFAGSVLISDTLKTEAKEAIASLKKLGVSKTLILSGDKKERAEEIGKKLGINEVKSELLPDGKYKELEKIIAKGTKVMYVGDGINDAPSLSLADVGVAMGGVGSDSAIECADLVITSDNLMKLPEAVKLASKTLRIAKQNIVFALSVKVAVLILSALGIANMWLAVFADVGVAVIAILNSMRTLITK